MNQAQPKTFMLLPDFMQKPDHRIHLGTLLLLNGDTKLPDPDDPLNEDTRVPIADDDVLRLTEEPWLYTRGRTYSGNLSLTAEIPVFTPVGGGFVLSRSKSEDLTIRCDKVETTRFAATKAYLARTLAAERFVQDYCQQTWSPSVYLVTGLKTAHNAVISNGRSRSYEGSLDPSVDTTSVGVPVKFGVSVGTESAEERNMDHSIKEPFIMAYQLTRLKLRRDGSLKKAESYNNYALFDDTRSDLVEDLADSFDSQWEVEEVAHDTVHDT
jgi:hypothetical protein